MLGFCLLVVSLGMQEHCGDYKRHLSISSTEAAPSAFVCPAHIAILGPPTIPKGYSSTITIPKLNFRFPKCTVTMQGTYADKCREGYRGEPEWATTFRRGAWSVRR